MDASKLAAPIPPRRRTVREAIDDLAKLDDEERSKLLKELEDDVQEYTSVRYRTAKLSEGADEHLRLYQEFVKGVEREAEGLDDEAAIRMLAFPDDFDKLYKLLRDFITLIHENASSGPPRTGPTISQYKIAAGYRDSLQEIWIPRMYDERGATRPPPAEVYREMTKVMLAAQEKNPRVKDRTVKNHIVRDHIAKDPVVRDRIAKIAPRLIGSQPDHLKADDGWYVSASDKASSDEQLDADATESNKDPPGVGSELKRKAEPLVPHPHPGLPRVVLVCDVDGPIGFQSSDQVEGLNRPQGAQEPIHKRLKSSVTTKKGENVADK